MAESSFDLIKQIVGGSTAATDWLAQVKAAQTSKAAQNAAALQNQIQGAGAVGGVKGATPGDDAFQMFMRAIAQQESGGSYKAMGAVVNGDQAYGKYQIMGANIPAWTKAALGTAMTPQQFLKSKAAQDATAKYHLWNYYKQYGPKKAAMAWNQGVAGMQEGYGKSYGHDIMERMRAYGYTNGMPQGGNPNGGPGGMPHGGGWVSPIAGMNDPTSNYGWRINPVTGQRSFHEGVDYGAAQGMRVGAAHGGQIVESGWDPIYGNRVIMETPKGKQILYGHLNHINGRWDVGDSVNAGQRLGQVGTTGMSTGPHLHFGVYDPSGDPMNPMNIINNRMGQPGAPQNRPGGNGGNNGGGGNQGRNTGQQVAQGIVRNPNDKFNAILHDLGL